MYNLAYEGVVPSLDRNNLTYGAYERYKKGTRKRKQALAREKQEAITEISGYIEDLTMRIGAGEQPAMTPAAPPAVDPCADF